MALFAPAPPSFPSGPPTLVPDGDALSLCPPPPPDPANGVPTDGPGLPGLLSGTSVFLPPPPPPP